MMGGCWRVRGEEKEMRRREWGEDRIEMVEPLEGI